LNGPSFKALDFGLHPLPSVAVSVALPRGHVALAFVDVGVGFADRAAVVVAVGFSQDLWVLNIGRPRKRWRDQFHFEYKRNRNQT